MIALLLIIPFIIGLFTRPESWTSFLSNSYFYISSPILLVSLFGAVLKDGTFDFFHYAWKIYGPRLFKPRPIEEEGNDEEEADEDDLHQLSRSIGSWYRKGLKLGGIFLALALFFLLLYYIL